MTVLFIARRFPPSVGGMERFAYDLSQSLKPQTKKMKIITWGGSNKWLPIILPWLTLRGFWALLSDRSIDVIHIQDASISPIGWVLHKLFNRPYVVVAHGLDITFENALYQKIIPWFLKRAAAIISISKATCDEVIKRGISKNNAYTIPLGITNDTLKIIPNKLLLEKKLSIKNLENKKIIITIGRLVKRKGVAWFVENIMPEVAKNKDVIYLIAGEGTERQLIETAIKTKRLSGAVYLLGKIDEETKNLLYRSADIFVMPNIKVSGDMEGFGRVAHEAAVAGLPVVASDLEGIKEAIKHRQNGILIKSGDVKNYKKELEILLRNKDTRVEFGKKARVYTLKNFSWAKISLKYLKIYKQLQANKKV